MGGAVSRASAREVREGEHGAHGEPAEPAESVSSDSSSETQSESACQFHQGSAAAASSSSAKRTAADEEEDMDWQERVTAAMRREVTGDMLINQTPHVVHEQWAVRHPAVMSQA